MNTPDSQCSRMKEVIVKLKRSLFLALIVIILLLSAVTNGQPSRASGESITGTCSLINVSGLAPAFDDAAATVYIGSTILGNAFSPPSPTGSYSLSIPIPAQPSGTTMSILVTGFPFPYTFNGTFTCGGAGVTFFTPGDSRVDPRPNDR